MGIARKRVCRASCGKLLELNTKNFRELPQKEGVLSKKCRACERKEWREKDKTRDRLREDTRQSVHDLSWTGVDDTYF